MDSGHFDDFSRKLATRSNRRDAVKTGGVVAAMAGAFGLRSAKAQDDDDTSCTWAFEAVVLQGPNKDATYEGTLAVDIKDDGAIDDGSLETEAEDPYDVVGYTKGKSLNLRIIISKDLALACTGVGERNIRSCQGQIDGTFAGPEFGDIGVWRIKRQLNSGNSDGSPTVVATGTAASGGGNGSGGGSGSGGDSGSGGGSGSNPTNTPCAPESCGLNQIWDADQCECICEYGGIVCGPDLCCPYGSICTSTTSCECPAGQVVCGDSCVDDCTGSPGQYLDYNTCQCVQGCPSGQVLCNGDCISCSAQEQLDTNTCTCVPLCPSGQEFCSGVCKDVVNDKNNCGACGNVCPTGMPCIAGSCICPATYKYCASQSKCIPEANTCA